MSLLKRRGIIFPAFEIHGGVAGLFDYGPVGGRLLRKVQQAWREHWLCLGNVVEIDSPTLTPHSVLEASGHVGAFNDHASECAACGAVFRSTAGGTLQRHESESGAKDVPLYTPPAL